MGCVFCEATTEPHRHAIVYRDDRFGILMDKYPIVRGHVLVFPVEHIPDVLELPMSRLGALMALAAKLSAALKDTYTVERVGLFTGGKAITEHGHVHLLPLSEGLKKTFAGLSERERRAVEVDVLLNDGMRILSNMRKVG